MRIISLTGSFYPKIGGGAFVQWEFARELAAQGDKVTVVTPREDGESRYEVVDGVEIRRPFRSTPSGVKQSSILGILSRIFYTLIVTAYLLRLSSNTGVDIVYSSSHTLHFSAKVLSLAHQVPLVQFVGYTPSVDPDERSYTNPLYVMEKINFRLFMGEKVFCRTPEVRSYITTESGSDVEIIHGILREDAIQAVDTRDLEEGRDAHTRTDEEERLLIFVGRLVEIKRPERLLDIVCELPSNCRLLIVGDGEKRGTLETEARDRRLSERIDFTGELPHDETLRRIAMADDLLLTSDAEAYPTVVFEALALSTNVFAPPVGILPTISHPRLQLGAPSEFGRMIQQTDLPSSSDVDREVLERYSIERYTDRMTETFAELARS